MAGFVVFPDGARWTVSNRAWRAVFERANAHLAPQSDAYQAVSEAVRGGLHYLDLTASPPGVVSDIASAVRLLREEGVPERPGLVGLGDAVDLLLGRLDSKGTSHLPRRRR